MMTTQELRSKLKEVDWPMPGGSKSREVLNLLLGAGYRPNPEIRARGIWTKPGSRFCFFPGGNGSVRAVRSCYTKGLRAQSRSVTIERLRKWLERYGGVR